MSVDFYAVKHVYCGIICQTVNSDLQIMEFEIRRWEQINANFILLLFEHKHCVDIEIFMTTLRLRFLCLQSFYVFFL